jgi:hypothetical protein
MQGCLEVKRCTDALQKAKYFSPLRVISSSESQLTFRRNISSPSSETTFFNYHSAGWSPAGSTWHVGRWSVYCTCPDWLWWWRIWWNEDWQGKPKYSEKTFPAPLCPPQIPLDQTRARTRVAAVGSQRPSETTYFLLVYFSLAYFSTVEMETR